MFLRKLSDSKVLDAISAVRVFPRGGSSSGYPVDRARIQYPGITMRVGVTILALSVLACMGVLGQTQNQSGFTPGSTAPAAPTSRASTAAQRENHDPLLDLPPLPHKEVTLIGGTVISMDEVMNRMVVQPFGGKQKMRIRLDARTHFYRDGQQITEREIQQGQRIYLDTMLNGDKVFAKTIWIRTSVESGSSRGQIVEFNRQHQMLTVRDELSDQPVKMQVGSAVMVRRGNQTVTQNDLVEGALVDLSFGPQKEIREITLLATPGTAFTFAGRVTYLDLSRKLIAIANRSDGKNYDVYMDAIAPSILRRLREGVDVTVSAVFDGTRYAARQIDLPTSKS